VYVYDIANRLIEVDGVSYTWDANGNLLNDGMRTYTYNHANRLVGVSQGGDEYAFGYNGIGDRLKQTVNGDPTAYTLDLNVGLTQVLADGTNAYMYGLGRIGEAQPDGWMYHLPDALGSVRQLVDPPGGISLARSYEPFGSPLDFAGGLTSSYGFTGEWTDTSGLLHLRARYYIPSQGCFLTRDVWASDYKKPMSLHYWLYALANPINFSDPSGLIPKRHEIGTKFIYSCNCGWIDFGHANPANAYDIFRLLSSSPTPPQNAEVRNDLLAIDLKVHLPIISFIALSKTAVVKAGLSGQSMEEVALGMYMEREDIRERYQSWPVARWIGKSGYSEEDLTSNLIGFYMAKYGYSDVRQGYKINESNPAWIWLSNICEFPEDLEEAKQWSKDVFDTYPEFRQGIKEWGKPRVECTSDIDKLCFGPRGWPSQFRTINPQDPAPWNDWWLYSPSRELVDGRLISRDCRLLEMNVVFRLSHLRE
jgi:RHS repeat-associated protein